MDSVGFHLLILLLVFVGAPWAFLISALMGS